MAKKKKKTDRSPILAAGGIVTRGRARPVFAVVRLRRQKSWVLPKGKLNRNESAIAAARREAIEETGHDVTVGEFLGSLAYLSSGRPKVVKFWRMEAGPRPVAKLMKDVSAVRWLPLAQAVEKLTHQRERDFLAKVGPHVVTPPARPARSGSKRQRSLRGSGVAANGKHRAGRSEQIRRLRLKASAAPRVLVQTLWRWLGR